MRGGALDLPTHDDINIYIYIHICIHSDNCVYICIYGDNCVYICIYGGNVCILCIHSMCIVCDPSGGQVTY